MKAAPSAWSTGHPLTGSGHLITGQADSCADSRDLHLRDDRVVANDARCSAQALLGEPAMIQDSALNEFRAPRTNTRMPRLRANLTAATELAYSEEELRLILDESAKAARISPVSQEIATNAFEIRRRLVREVMTPRGEVVYLDASLSFRDNLQSAKAARHTRFPLCV
jgi:hypothetical protein